MAQILVYSEESAVQRELLGKARQAAAEQGIGEVAAVVLGAAAAATAAPTPPRFRPSQRSRNFPQYPSSTSKRPRSPFATRSSDPW